MQTYLDYYNQEISPKIQALDIFLKTQKEPYSWDVVADFLGLELEELSYILKKEKFGVITKGVFFYLMHRLDGSFSIISTMIHREMERNKNNKNFHGNKDYYSIEEISHIYLIEKNTLELVAETIGKSKFTYEELNILFEKISINQSKD